MTETIYALPYTARLVIGHFLADTAITDLVGTHVFTDIAEGAYPCVHVVQLPGRIVESGTVHWLAEDLLQINCYGGSRLAAHELAIECQRSLKALRGSVTYTIGSTDVAAVVTGTTVGGIGDRSDDRFDPAKPYSHFDVVIAAHPSQSGS